MVKKITVAGYFGFQNAGDELILESIINNVTKEIKDVQITVLSSNPVETARSFNVSAVYRWNPISVVRAIKGCDLLICSGGLYQDITSSPSLYYYLILIVIARMLFKKIILYGVEFGPITYEFNKRILRIILKFVDKITVRSKGSFDFLKDTGINGNLILSGDPALNIFIKPINRYVSKKINRIGMILRRPSSSVNEQILILSQFCQSIIKRLDVELIFVPFHLEQDLYFSLEIIRNLDSKANAVRWNNPGELYNILSNVDFIISQRLHGLIIGAVLRIPILGISNDPKFANFMQELGQKHFLLPNVNIDIVVGVIQDIWYWQKEFNDRLEKTLPQLQYRAFLNTLNTIELLGAKRYEEFC